MNKKIIISLALFALISFSALQNHVYAQTPTATVSAQTQPTILPPLFPTTTPPQSALSWQILQQFDDLAIPATSSATASATELVPPFVTEYCLDVPVIMYHHIEPMAIATQLGHPQLTVDNMVFEEQVRYLIQHNYHIISADDLVTALKMQHTVPEKSVLITIDDGYIDNYSYAFMIAKKYKVVMNFMIPSGLIGQPDYMTWDHLKEMAASPYARIYNHTTSHAALGLIDKEKIVQEVTTANQQFTTNLGLTTTIVAYPYGSYNDLAVQTLKELGTTAAFSTDPGRNECTSNIMQLPRVRVGNSSISEYGF